MYQSIFAPIASEPPLHRAVVILAVLLITVCTVSFTVEADGNDENKKHERMMERLNELEEENTRLKERLDSLESESDGAEPQQNDLNKNRQGKDLQQALDEKLDRFKEDLQDDQPQAGLHPGGGGFFIRDDNYHLRLLGYTQVVGSLFDGSLNRADENGDFSIRRSRIDFIADLYEDYQIFIEFDGGVGTTSPPDSESDFALVVARLNWKLSDDALQLRLGKMITPFSTENFRSSRSLDTVERYMALNSMFLLPALDVQFGSMLHGKVGSEKRLGYFLGVFNGNGRANDNLSDNNDEKEIQGKLKYEFSDELSAGLGLDISHEEAQTLSLADLGFNRYVSVPVEGDRLGVGGDVFWKDGPWSFRTEGLGARFDTPDGDDVGLYGGFVQPAVFTLGDRDDGLQLLVRGEVAGLADTDTSGNGDTLWAVTGGANWYVNPNVRVQVNATGHYFDGPSSIQGFSDSEFVPMLQTMVQFKF